MYFMASKHPMKEARKERVSHKGKEQIFNPYVDCFHGRTIQNANTNTK
jgi:hypothetical protein